MRTYLTILLFGLIGVFLALVCGCTVQLGLHVESLDAGTPMGRCPNGECPYKVIA